MMKFSKRDSRKMIKEMARLHGLSVSEVREQNGLLPYPVIVSASQGDILAMNVVLCHYEPYIARLSMRTSIDEYGNPHTSVDEDMRSRLEAKLIEQVLNFKVA